MRKDMGTQSRRFVRMCARRPETLCGGYDARCVQMLFEVPVQFFWALRKFGRACSPSPEAFESVLDRLLPSADSADNEPRGRAWKHHGLSAGERYRHVSDDIRRIEGEVLVRVWCERVSI